MDALQSFARLSGRHLVNGQLVAGKGSKVHSVIDPATEARIGEVADATMDELNGRRRGCPRGAEVMAENQLSNEDTFYSIRRLVACGRVRRSSVRC